MSTDASVTPSGARNATLADLAALLRDQQARKADIVAPAATIRAENARLVVAGTDPVLDLQPPKPDLKPARAVLRTVNRRFEDRQPEAG